MYDYEFPIEIGEIVHINGIPYEHLGDGKLGGGTDPEYARKTIIEQMEEVGVSTGA